MERLTLPLPARGIWLRIRSLLGPALELLGREAGPWKIDGGTVLAARCAVIDNQHPADGAQRALHLFDMRPVLRIDDSASSRHAHGQAPR